jgi:hypothetical protein
VESKILIARRPIRESPWRDHLEVNRSSVWRAAVAAVDALVSEAVDAVAEPGRDAEVMPERLPSIE